MAQVTGVLIDHVEQDPADGVLVSGRRVDDDRVEFDARRDASSCVDLATPGTEGLVVRRRSCPANASSDSWS